VSLDGRALRIEGNGPVLWSGPQTEFVERTPGKNSSAEPRANMALKLSFSVPSLLQTHPSIDVTREPFALVQPSRKHIVRLTSGSVLHYLYGETDNRTQRKESKESWLN
jgi:hypothetical protein